MFNFWKDWTLLVEQQVLIHSSRDIKLQKHKGSSPTKSLITPIKCRTQNFHRMTPFIVNVVAVNLTNLNTWTMSTNWKVNWQQNKSLWNWNYKNHPYWKWDLSNSATNMETGTNELSRMFFATLFGWNCCADFRGNAGNDCLLPRQMYCFVKTWLYFTKPSPHSSTQVYWRKFYPFTAGDKVLLGILKNMLLVVLRSFLHEKQLRMKILFQNQQTYATLLLGLMLINYTPIQCVNPCRHVFISVGISIRRRVELNIDKKRP